MLSELFDFDHIFSTYSILANKSFHFICGEHDAFVFRAAHAVTRAKQIGVSIQTSLLCNDLLIVEDYSRLFFTAKASFDHSRTLFHIKNFNINMFCSFSLTVSMTIGALIMFSS